MKKIKAAGDEADRWEARTEEEIREAGLWSAVDEAVKEIDNFDSAMISENGREWTRIWHELELPKLYDAEESSSIGEQTALELLRYAEGSDQAKGLLMEVMAFHVETGRALPECLRKRLASHLRGIEPITAKGETEQGPKNWARNYMINHVASLIYNIYPLKRTRGKMSQEEIAVSDIVYHALNLTKKDGIGFGTVQNIIFDPDPPRKPVSEQNQKNYVEIRALILTSLFDDVPE